MSWPRSATRTGCADSGETRYWYHEMSHANVSTISELTPESGVIDDERLAERLRDAGDRAPELRRVEELGRLDERDLVVAEPAQDRLADDGLRLRPRAHRAATARASAAGAGAPAAAASARRRRPPAPSRGRAPPPSRAGRRRRSWLPSGE